MGQGRQFIMCPAATKKCPRSYFYNDWTVYCYIKAFPVWLQNIYGLPPEPPILYTGTGTYLHNFKMIQILNCGIEILFCDAVTGQPLLGTPRGNGGVPFTYIPPAPVPASFFPPTPPPTVSFVFINF